MILMALALTLSPVMAQDGSTPSVTDEDIGTFSADHPLHVFERASDQIQMAVGTTTPEQVLEKRAVEAHDLQNRGVDGVDRALDRVNSAAQRVDSEEAQEALQNVSNRLNSIAENNPDMADKSREIFSDRTSTSNDVEDIAVSLENGTVSVSGVYEAPNTGYELVNTDSTVDNSTVTMEFYMQESQERPVHTPVMTEVEFSNSVNVSMENFDTTVEVYKDGELDLEKTVDFGGSE